MSQEDRNKTFRCPQCAGTDLWELAPRNINTGEWEEGDEYVSCRHCDEMVSPCHVDLNGQCDHGQSFKQCRQEVAK